MFEICREKTFSASHQLREYQGKCERLHGHNWRVRVHISGETLDDAGMLLDFHVLDQMITEVVARFDHQHLNEVAPFTQINPSSENLARLICEEIGPRLPAGRGLRVKCCDVWENDASRARFVP